MLFIRTRCKAAADRAQAAQLFAYVCRMQHPAKQQVTGQSNVHSLDYRERRISVKSGPVVFH